MVKYIGLVRKDETSDYSVDFPDFPGCITVGYTLQEAIEMAQEAIELHTEGMAEDKEPYPEPTSFEEIDAADDDYSAAILVEVNFPYPPTKK